MPTNQDIQALIDYVKRSAGEWVKADNEPTIGHYYLCKVDTKRDCIVETIVEWARFKNGYYDWDLKNVAHFGDFGEESEIIEWLDPSESTKEQILSLLSCLVISDSDEEVAKECRNRWYNAGSTAKECNAVEAGFKHGMTHARLQMQAEQSAEIKVLEEKVENFQKVADSMANLLENIRVYTSGCAGSINTQDTTRRVVAIDKQAELGLNLYNQLQQS